MRACKHSGSTLWGRKWKDLFLLARRQALWRGRTWINPSQKEDVINAFFVALMIPYLPIFPFDTRLTVFQCPWKSIRTKPCWHIKNIMNCHPAPSVITCTTLHGCPWKLLHLMKPGCFDGPSPLERHSVWLPWLFFLFFLFFKRSFCFNKFSPEQNLSAHCALKWELSEADGEILNQGC